MKERIQLWKNLLEEVSSPVERGVDDDPFSPFIVAFDTGRVPAGLLDEGHSGRETALEDFVVGLKLLTMGEYDAGDYYFSRVDPEAELFREYRPWIKYLRGRSFFMAGDLGKAEVEFQQLARSVTPRQHRRLHLRVQRALATLFAYQGKFRDALERLQALEPDFSPLEHFYTLTIRGNILTWNMLLEEAMVEYGLALKIVQDHFPDAPRLKARISSLSAEVAAWEGVPLLGAFLFEAQEESFVEDRARYHAALALETFLRGRWSDAPAHLLSARNALKGRTPVAALVQVVDFLQALPSRNWTRLQISQGNLGALSRRTGAYRFSMLPMYIALRNDAMLDDLKNSIQWLNFNSAVASYTAALRKSGLRLPG